MGRLAIIEEEGGGSKKPPPEPPSSSDKTSSSDSASSNQAKTSEVSTSRMKQGGISDESGYYEGDELRDDSIEIVYDRHNQARNLAATNTTVAVSNVSITPLVNTAPKESNGKSYNFCIFIQNRPFL